MVKKRCPARARRTNAPSKTAHRKNTTALYTCPTLPLFRFSNHRLYKSCRNPASGPLPPPPFQGITRVGVGQMGARPSRPPPPPPPKKNKEQFCPLWNRWLMFFARSTHRSSAEMKLKSGVGERMSQARVDGQPPPPPLWASPLHLLGKILTRTATLPAIPVHLRSASHHLSPSPC